MQRDGEDFVLPEDLKRDGSQRRFKKNKSRSDIVKRSIEHDWYNITVLEHVFT